MIGNSNLHKLSTVQHPVLTLPYSQDPTFHHPNLPEAFCFHLLGVNYRRYL